MKARSVDQGLLWPKPLLICCCLVFCAGCATPKAQFVLLEEPDGSVGEIYVTNEMGTSEIGGARETIRVAREGSAPATGKTLEPKAVDARYGKVLSFLPPPPQAFNVQFMAGSAELGPGSEEELRRAAETVRVRGSMDISLNGHTDTVGTPESNLALSLQRAETVRQWLMREGIPAEHFTVEYYGESDPLVPTADEVEEPRNRRVEIVVR